MTTTIAGEAVGAGGVPPTARRARFEQWLPALRYCSVVYLIVRIGLLVLGAAAWVLTDERRQFTALGIKMTNGWHNAIVGWIKFDVGYFIAIAQHGYQNHNATAAFYPGYPILIRAASYLCFGNLHAAGLLVSNAALLAALVVVYRLTEREYDVAMARRAVLYLCLFPTAFFLFDIYSESVFLLAAVGALALARSHHWGWAGLAGLYAALTRSIGVVLVLALATEAIQQTIEDRRLRAGGSVMRRHPAAMTAGRLAASALPIAGPAGYLLFWQLRFHDWYEPIQLEKVVWGRQFSLPWATLARAVNVAAQYGLKADQGWRGFDLLVVGIGLVLAAWVAVRARPAYAVYTWGSIAFFLLEIQPGRPLASDPRYLVTLFPIAWALAKIGQRQHGHEVVLAVSSASLAITSWLFLSTTGIY